VYHFRKPISLSECQFVIILDNQNMLFWGDVGFQIIYKLVLNNDTHLVII